MGYRLSPCYQCAERHLGCHNEDTCAKWAEYQRVHQAEKAERDKRRKMENEDYYTHKRMAASIKRAKRKK